MRHNAEGTFLSLRRPLDGLSAGDCRERGSGYRRQRILALTAHAGAAIQPRELSAAPAPAEPIPVHRISKKVRSGIEFMVMGDCKIIKDAAEKAPSLAEILASRPGWADKALRPRPQQAFPVPSLR